ARTVARTSSILARLARASCNAASADARAALASCKAFCAAASACSSLLPAPELLPPMLEQPTNDSSGAVTQTNLIAVDAHLTVSSPLRYRHGAPRAIRPM